MTNKYKIKEKADDHLDTVIEKGGLTASFTVRGLNAAIERATKLIKELEGKLQIEDARKQNIEHFHPFVKDMSDQDLNTAAMYSEAKQYITQIPPKIEELKAAIEKDHAEVAKAYELLGVPSPLNEQDNKQDKA